MNAKPRVQTVGVVVPSDPRGELSQLLREALAMRARGADILDLDTLATGRRRGPFADADDDTLALLVAGLVDAGVEVCVTTDRPHTAGLAAEHGAAWISDPSAGAAARLDPRVVESDCGLIIGPWGHPASAATVDIPGWYAQWLMRNAARLLDAGIASDRLRLDAGAGLSADDAAPWRIIDGLDRLAGIGYPLLVPATEEFLAEMVADESPEERLDDAAVALAALAAGVDAWAVRTQRVDVVAGVLARMHGKQHVTRHAPTTVDP